MPTGPIKPDVGVPVEKSTEPTKLLALETTQGLVVINLRPDLAPNHVAHISKLVSEGFYDGIAFHRVIEGFMAQTGCPHGTGTGGSKYPNLKQEFNAEPHVRGVCSMARSSNPDSANSQFFICFDDADFLNHQYTVWGHVVSGMENVDNLKRGEPVRDPDKILSAKLIIVPQNTQYVAPIYIQTAKAQPLSMQEPATQSAMSLSVAVSSCMRKFFTINGRAQRSEYFWFQFAYLFSVLISAIFAGTSGSFTLFYTSIFIGGVIPSITVTIRRLHDIDRSGWWILVLAVPIIGLFLWLIWFLERGTKGDNRFGSDPLAQDPNGVVNAQII